MMNLNLCIIIFVFWRCNLRKFCIISFVILCMSMKLIAKEKIETCSPNVYQLYILENETPVCFYYEEEEGLISIIRKYFVQIGNKKYGPYDEIIDFDSYENAFYYSARIDNNLYVYKIYKFFFF